MKKHIIHLLSLAALVLAGWSCETDYYNEHELDGYDPEEGITDVQKIDYTLTDADYGTIAKNSTNKATAEAAGQEAVDALAAIGKNKYFANEEEAASYIPAFLAATYPHLDDNSAVMVTYTKALDVPAEMQAMNAAASYTLTDENYKAVWGEETPVSALTPATIGKLKEVLPSEGLEAGQYLAVTYNWLAEEPSTGGDEPVDPDDPQPAGYTSVLGSAKLNDAVEVKGYVTALSARGAIVADNTGSVLFYDKNGTDLAIGDEVTVTGTMGAYNKGFQIDAAAGGKFEKTGTTTVSYPAAKTLTGADMDALLTSRTDNEYAEFVKIEGKMSISGNYYNVIVDGAATAQGSVYYASDAIKEKLTNEMTCTLYGYFVAISGGKFINIVVTHVNEAPAVANAYTSVLGSAKLNDAVEVKGYVTALSARGAIVADNTGSVLFYDKNGTDLAIGDEVTVTGTMGAYNKGFQIDAAAGGKFEKTGMTTVSYPAAKTLTGADMDALLTSRTDNEYAEFVKIEGKMSISGNYYNVIVDGAATAQGSVYYASDAIKEKLTNEMTCTLYGYFVAISGGKFINIVVTDVVPASKADVAKMAAAQSEKRYAFYKWDGAAFSAADVTMVQPADYTEMGQNYGNFTDPDQDIYLPKFLNKTYPYAAADQVKYVGYRCYKNKETSWAVDEYKNDGTNWIKTVYFTAKTDQFRKSAGAWAIDRTLELAFTEMGAADYKAFLQYCCNWVYDFIDVPLGAPARDNAGEILSTEKITVAGSAPAGSWWVSNYGNNEWYAGTYAYFGEMNWIASKARSTFEKLLNRTDLTDDEIISMMQTNAAEVFAGVLHYMYPEVTPDDYGKVVITVYDYGTKLNWSYTFNVTGQGTFEYVEGSLKSL